MNTRPIHLYLVKLYDPHGTELFYKIGITQDLRWRFSAGITQLAPGALPTAMSRIREALLKQKDLAPHPYQHSYLATKPFSSSQDAKAHERSLLDLVAVVSYVPAKRMSGYSECFQCDSDTVQMIADYINGLQDGPPDDQSAF